MKRYRSINKRLDDLQQRTELKKSNSKSIEQKIVQSALYYYYFELKGEQKPITPIELRMRKYDDVIRKAAVTDQSGGYVEPELEVLFIEMEESYKESPEAFQRFLDKYEVMKVNS